MKACQAAMGSGDAISSKKPQKNDARSYCGDGSGDDHAGLLLVMLAGFERTLQVAGEGYWTMYTYL